jgi:hypothetical protein
MPFAGVVKSKRVRRFDSARLVCFARSNRHFFINKPFVIAITAAATRM